MVRTNPRNAWKSFPHYAQTDWHEWTDPIRPSHSSANHVSIAEWPPGSYTLCDSSRQLGRTCCWIDPRRTRLDRQITVQGLHEVFSGPIRFIGGLAKDVQAAWRSQSTFIAPKCLQGLLIAPPLIDLIQLRFRISQQHGVIDSALLGGVLAASWNLYTFGIFDLCSFPVSLHPNPPITLAGRNGNATWRR